MDTATSNEVIVEAAKVIDPDAWLPKDEFRKEYGGFPGWSAGSQGQRQGAALHTARAVAAVLENASDNIPQRSSGAASTRVGALLAPTDNEREMLAEIAARAIRAGRYGGQMTPDPQPTEWHNPVDLRAGRRIVSSFLAVGLGWAVQLESETVPPAPGPVSPSAGVEPTEDYPDAEGLAALRGASDGSDHAEPASLVGQHATTRWAEMVEIIESVAMPQGSLPTREAEMIADAICARSECLHWTPAGMTGDVTTDRLYWALRDAGEGRATAEALSRKLARSLAIQASEEREPEASSEDARVLLALNATILPELAAPDLSSWDDEVVERMRAALRAADGGVARA